MAAVVISVALQKGGVGKSTTSQALASTLGFRKKKVLLIDMDSQANVTYSSNVDKPQKTITDVLGEDCKADEAIIHCKYYDLLAADSYLTNVEMAEGVESTLLKNAIEPIKNRYDYVIIDTPPALGNLSFNSLVASDYVVIPTEPRPFALQGLGALHNTIESVQKRLNPSLRVLGILLIKYSNRTVLNRDIKDMIEDYAKQMNTVVFDTTVREGIAVAEAQTVREPLIDYAKSSKPNIDYKAFTTELLHKIGE
ncbi:MAG: ParA family protein [Negativicutes bacterium]|nr:ParA family protein [Negativicutes bacterium]